MDFDRGGSFCSEYSYLWNNNCSFGMKIQKEFFDWSINTLNYLIFVYIFLKTIGTACFNKNDILITLIGITSSVFLLFIKTINLRFGKDYKS